MWVGDLSLRGGRGSGSGKGWGFGPGREKRDRRGCDGCWGGGVVSDDCWDGGGGGDDGRERAGEVREWFSSCLI